MRRFLAASLVALVAVPVAAQAPGAGRFEITPDDQGFIRLDTRTGATSHCARRSGVWTCQPVIEEVGALSDALIALDDRLDMLAARVDTVAPEDSQSRPAFDRGFIAIAVARLFELVRTLKYGRADEV